MSKILITIPTWNEARVIADTVKTVSAEVQKYLPEHEVTIEVADNASTDGTADIVRDVLHRFSSSALPHFCTSSLLVLPQKGKGLAIRSSWQRHLDDADVLVFMDADLAADLSALPRLINPVLQNKADIVCGSRFLRSSVVARRASREYASRIYRVLQRTILRLPVQDAQCGFKAISSEAARKLLPLCVENGWLFDTELLAMAAIQKARVLEIPVSWVENRDPERRSALKLFRHGWVFLLGIAKIYYRNIRLG